MGWLGKEGRRSWQAEADWIWGVREEVTGGRLGGGVYQQRRTDSMPQLVQGLMVYQALFLCSVSFDVPQAPVTQEGGILFSLLKT